VKSRLRLPGPLPEAVAVTVAAQLGVAPLLVHRFGPLPVASLPANLAAGWAAGAVMTLGLTVGPISGFLAGAGFGRIAWLLQAPALMLVTWIDSVAGWCATLPLPRLNGVAMILILLAGLMVKLRPRPQPQPGPQPLRPAPYRGGKSRLVIALAGAVIVLTLAQGLQRPPDLPAMLANDVLYLPPGKEAGSVLIVGDGAQTSAVDAVINSRLTHVDMLITERGDATAGHVVTALTEAAEIERVLAPSLHRIRGATRVTAETVIESAWGSIIVESSGDGKDLTITFRPRPDY